MIKSIPLSRKKGMPMKIFFMVSILIVFWGCTKTVTNQILQKEDILLSEISEWGKWYEKAIPNAPKLLIAKAEKIFFKNRFYVRVPIKGSKGMVYFGKSQSLEAVFIRINPDNGIVSYPFTGNYEFIDLNKFTYKQITFNNGKIGQVFQNLMIDKGSISGAQTVKTNSWFSQLLHCIGQYILAVPAKINGEWSGCWVLGSQGQDQEVESVGEGGGTTLPIDWSSFLININPPVTGPDPIPTGGTGVWALYTPPAYVSPIDPSTFWIGSFLQGDDLYSLSELDAYAQGLGYYWEDPSYDVNSNTFPPYDPIVDGPYDFQGYRKNGPSYQYVGGTVQNYTNDNGGKYAIFTSTNGTQTTFPGATITDYLVLPRAGVTTANGGIHMSTISNGLSDLQHEYGHYLQAQVRGFFYYYRRIVPASLYSAATDPAHHNYFWTEIDANQRSVAFFGQASAIANDNNYPK